MEEIGNATAEVHSTNSRLVLVLYTMVIRLRDQERLW
jgi:hypothetical protein